MSWTERLTEPQRRHLTELAALGPEAHWRAVRTGEQRSALALYEKGLLDREVGWGGRWSYFLTDAGRAAIAEEPQP